jgi:hypothetical protein
MRDALRSIEIEPPDFKLGEHRQDDFAPLGLRSKELVDRISAAYQLPAAEAPQLLPYQRGLPGRDTGDRRFLEASG